MRVAIYARYSTDNQRIASIEDQVRVCRERAEKENWSIIQIYSDHAVSGAFMMRPSIQQLVQDAIKGEFDIVVAEALDRLSRNQADIALLYQRLQFADIGLFTLSEGEISEIHIGLKGTMNALFLKDLSKKTHRGLRGRIEQGKSGGGKTFGYKTIRQFDGNGELIKGVQAIDEYEAQIVKRIYEWYAKGISPKKIAFRLNAEEIEGPSGKGWTQSTINGNRRRGIGVLNNELYIGRRVWNRQRFVKNPDTGKRIAKPNPQDQWIIREVPDLRIIDQDLWDAVKARQKDLDAKHTLGQKKSPPKLFSYLLKCGECGGGYSKISANHYGCSTSRNKGTCSNRLSIQEKELETKVLSALQAQLVNDKLVKEFCKAYVEHQNQIQRDKNASRNKLERELEKIERESKKVLDAILNDIDIASIKDHANALEARRKEIAKQLETTDEKPVYIHPNMAMRYQQEVNNLIQALNDPELKEEASEIIRKLISKIVLSPDTNRENLIIDLYGDLAGILQIAKNGAQKVHSSEQNLTKKILTEIEQVKQIVEVKSDRNSGNSGELQDVLVAGAGFEPATFRL